jgi:hypothetical protein
LPRDAQTQLLTLHTLDGSLQDRSHLGAIVRARRFAGNCGNDGIGKSHGWARAIPRQVPHRLQAGDAGAGRILVCGMHAISARLQTGRINRAPKLGKVRTI